MFFNIKKIMIIMQYFTCSKKFFLNSLEDSNVYNQTFTRFHKDYRSNRNHFQNIKKSSNKQIEKNIQQKREKGIFFKILMVRILENLHSHV